MHVRLSAAAILALGLWLTSANAEVTLTVPATSNPWLAGMPPGSLAAEGDRAPVHSPALVTGLTFAAGDLLRIFATGLTDHCDLGGRCGLAGPEGDYSDSELIYDHHWPGAEHGIADIYAHIDSLIGVFLDSTQPNLSPPPGALDFRTLAARDFASLSPLLKQPFFVGDGFRNDGTTAQSFIVPVGATRLFLGTMDAFGWYEHRLSLVWLQSSRSETAERLWAQGWLRGRFWVLLGKPQKLWNSWNLDV